MAGEVLTNNQGLATGVAHINKEDMQEYGVAGKVVIVAAIVPLVCLIKFLRYI